MRVYNNQYGWSYSAKAKDQSGEEIKDYIPVKFSSKNQTPPSDDLKCLDLTFSSDDMWICPYKNKLGEIKHRIVLMRWQANEVVESIKPKDSTNSTIKPEEMDLPFF